MFDFFKRFIKATNHATPDKTSIVSLSKTSSGHHDLSCDTKLLHALGLMDHEYDARYCQIHRQEVEDEVNAITLNLGRAKHGFRSRKFKVRSYEDGHNEYFVGNWARPECPREEMYKMIAEAAGKGDFDSSRFL